MTRQEKIHEVANTIDPNIGKEWIDKDYNCVDVYDFTIGFECGAKWADENPNLYSDEKYHTVKVSQLDELNRKAELYDKVVDNLPKILEFLCETWGIEKDFNNFLLDNLIQELQEKLEE
jgi:hypothetical protein